MAAPPLPPLPSPPPLPRVTIAFLLKELPLPLGRGGGTVRLTVVKKNGGRFCYITPQTFYLEVMFLKGQCKATRLVPDGMHGWPAIYS
jgi:hypothetical protein